MLKALHFVESRAQSVVPLKRNLEFRSLRLACACGSSWLSRQFFDMDSKAGSPEYEIIHCGIIKDHNGPENSASCVEIRAFHGSDKIQRTHFVCVGECVELRSNTDRPYLALIERIRRIQGEWHVTCRWFYSKLDLEQEGADCSRLTCNDVVLSQEVSHMRHSVPAQWHALLGFCG